MRQGIASRARDNDAVPALRQPPNSLRLTLAHPKHLPGPIPLSEWQAQQSGLWGGTYEVLHLRTHPHRFHLR